MANEEENKLFIESFCTNVQNPDRAVRQRALKQFSADFLPKQPTAACSGLFDATYLHLLRCYSDRFESIRTLAVETIDLMLERLPANDFYLGYIVPVLAKRIGQAEIIEESEELRLLLLEQLERLVQKYRDPDGTAGDPLLKVFDEIIDILIKTLRDPYPAAQKKSCEIVMALGTATPSLHYRAEALVAPAKMVLSHRHSANRIVAVETLGLLSLHILSNGDRISEIIMAISPLLMDDVPYVRRACGRAGCLMLMKLRDRYSFFHRILPLVLNCLTDDTAEVRDDILVRWKEAGQLYYLENETELSKVAVIEKLPEGYPTDRYTRPTLPCRSIVQRSLRVVNLVLREMEEWKENIRLHATKLLKQIVLHAESSFSTLYAEVNQVLAKACMDSDKSIVMEALSVCELLGILLQYDTWSKHVLLEFRKYPSIGQLRCMRTLYAHCGQCELKQKDIKRFVALLLDVDVCHNQKEDYQHELLEFCDVLVTDSRKGRDLSAMLEEITVSDGGDNAEQSLERMLYTVVLKVVAFCYESKGTIHEKGLNVLNRLDTDIDKLHEMHLASVLGRIEHLESEHSDASTSLMLLCGIVSICRFQESYFEPLRSTLEKALSHAAPEGKVKLFSAISIALLGWSEKNNQANDVQLTLLKPFIEVLIAPYLVWAAGRSAESIRTMATACFASLAQGVNVDVYASLLPGYLNVLAGLIEDNNIATRVYTLKALLRLEPLDLESLKLIAFPIMSRLDDPSAEVRELAATCLGSLKLKSIADADEGTFDRWQEVLKQIVSVMMLHLEHPEIKLRSAIFVSMKRLYADNRELISRLVNEVPSGCPYKKDLDRISYAAVDEQ
ncbi:dynein assembly factor 5, axonemal-like [Anopheles albimanus]|uniref:TOG domain-containing protein n=1 Tax=Anopheles albimanus TaxID=7167 RepID=A0A182F7Z7_ANOAL|nr:dynein assembly factor 5, axonemal-like [Anopheles albimanus]XP_035777078.1 dynein assembly factor 5, axonemal-like [Anopheles albimanus]